MNRFHDVEKVATPRRTQWIKVQIFSSFEEARYDEFGKLISEKPFHQAGDLVFCPDGTLILGTKAFYRRQPIDEDLGGTRLYRAAHSNVVQIQFARGEKRFYMHQKRFLSWTWYELFVRDKPPSRLRRLFGST